MTQFKRLIAFLLCLLMIFPTQELTILAETMSMDLVQIEEMISEEPAKDGTDRVEEVQQSDSMEDGEERIKETLPLEPMEEETERVKETLPLEPMEEETERVTETLPLDPMQEETERVTETLPLEPMEEETERIKETLPLEPITGGNGGAGRIDKTLLLEAMDDEGYAIYWNPGGQLPVDLATPSNATVNATATESDAASTKAKAGRDTASGLSPAKPVKTLAKAIERAKKLIEKEGLDPSDVTIYAMNPMEIADGEFYALNAGNIRIASWSGRPYESDALFYVNGGQLTLMNVLLEAEEPAHESNETELVYVQGGVLQMGQNVNINGCVIMDYSSEQEAIEWKNEWKDDFATPSIAVKADDTTAEQNNRIEKILPIRLMSSATKKAKTAGEASFNIDNYKIDTDEETIKLVKDKKSVSTWREPIIELIEGFDGSNDEYLLKVNDDGKVKTRELVKTLYADEASADDFLNYFSLAESDNWSLQVEVEAAAQLRGAGSEDVIQPLSSPLEEETLTSKTLIAIRPFVDGIAIYWNPGGRIDDYYNAGDDSYDGLTPRYPVKTWSKAAEFAKQKGTTVIVAMQSLDLGAEHASDYLDLTDGTFCLASEDSTIISTLYTWNVTAQPAIIVPENKTLNVKNLYLGGMYNDGNVTEDRTILVNKGNLIIDENVGTGDKGYIQVNAFPGLKDHPIQVCGVGSGYDDPIRVFFSGINDNIEYRYVDVVIPDEALKEAIEIDEDPIEKANSVGVALKDRFNLHSSNKSKIDWYLRQDTADDGSIANAQNLELYADYYFDSIYIDGEDGDDDNYGATCDYPVKTWAQAIDIWNREMTTSINARTIALALGSMTTDEIEVAYPMPDKIYICNTVTVSDDETWELELKSDPIRGEVKTEVLSHIDSATSKVEGSTKEHPHNPPEIMIKVTDEGILNIKNVLISNMVDDPESVTIAVEKKGTLNLTGNTTLTGTLLKNSDFEQKTLTLGSHVRVGKDSGSGHFVMEQGWNGSIEYREQGVVAIGKDAKVEMKGGSIQKNNSYREDHYATGNPNHKKGGGVALSGGATFIMNEGVITENKTYQYGAGVYLEGENTSFIMKAGKITYNSMPTYRVSNTDSTLLRSQGAGIFAGTDTTLEIGSGSESESGVREDTLISNNKASLADGTGIYADGNLTINKAAIIGNEAGGANGNTSINTSISYGVGIYVGSNGTFVMHDGLVKGNHGSFSNYGSVRGAGIYIADGKEHSHSISGSTITENEVGYEYDSNGTIYTQGGGIYLASGNTLTIEKTEISKNRAGCGGGIYAVGSAGHNIYLTLKEGTCIVENIGSVYNPVYTTGMAGGMYFSGYGTLTLEDGTKINGNFAKMASAGLYISGDTQTSAHVYMMATEQGAIEICGNEITNAGDAASYGGGVTHFGGSWHAKNVLISNNKGGGQGGGIYSNRAHSCAYFREMVISGNEARDGAALAIGDGHYYMQDSSIINNNATNRGGGIYASGNGYIYLSETAGGLFEIRGNRADYGGGIGIVNASTFMMDINGQIKNHADAEGSNFYLSGYANIDILNGHFEQPDDPVDRVHNIYINDTSTTTFNKYFDFGRVVVDKKDGANPDAILLNSGSSFLTVLAAPPSDELGILPIDLNPEVFKSGSVVLKPVGNYTAAIIRPMHEPDADLMTEVQNDREYHDFMDAASNLNYYCGGELPRRTEMVKSMDTNNSARTNVILIGQGVYLDGTNGDDINHHGTSPTDAVATFDRAKIILKERIEYTAEQEAGLSEDEGEGFAPFIYICGQVNIDSNEDWELNYKDELYKDVNKRYAAAEGSSVCDAQVRRYASFVNKPMITVKNGGTFTTKSLIINGMADAVVLTDQDSRSPVIEGLAGSHVILTGDSMITNNYYSALDISGELILNSEYSEDGGENKQLYNNQALHAVRLYGSAKMWMLGDAKIITDNTVEKITSFTSNGISILGTDVSVTMSGKSAIIQGQGSALLDGKLINSTYINATIKMEGSARLEVGSDSDSAMYCSGSGSKINMSGNTSIVALESGSWSNGIYMGADNSLKMSDQANITYGGIIKSTTCGVNMSPTNTTAAKVTMQDDAVIAIADTVTSGYYVYYGISVSSGTSSEVNLLGNAKITGNRKVENYTSGININSQAKGTAIILDGKAVLIKDMWYGIQLGSAASVSMRKNAKISNSTYGIYMTNIRVLTSETTILMEGESKICNSEDGIYFFTSCDGPINIILKGDAAIEQNIRGISDIAGSGGIGPWRLNVEMFNSARISGNSGSGIYLGSLRTGWSGSNSYQKITLNDNAMIGGEQYYSSTNAESGNHEAGIYANGPIQLTMNKNAKISGNGTNENNDDQRSSGIFLTRSTSTSYYRAGTASVILNDSASICDNRGGGVYAATVVSSSGVPIPNEVLIELNGIKADGSFSKPSIEGNTDAIFLGTDATLKLKGEAQIKDPNTTSSYKGKAIDDYGHIELDGRSTIEGLIYMNTVTNPIEMTHEATGSDPKYYLHLIEGFVGQNVVIPGPSGDIDDLTTNGNKDSQLVYFNKYSAEGMAADRQLAEKSPNLVLEGENNVYLSGNGKNTNSGDTPSTPVRDFKVARERLQEKSAGANIIICGSAVSVLAGDEDWSFEPGGYVINPQSQERWKPRVIRYKDYTGVLIVLYDGTNAGYASTVTFKDIIIDGGSDDITLTTSSENQLMTVGRLRTAILGEGAVLQNNKVSTSSVTTLTTAGVKVFGTLEINGGTIQNIVRESPINAINYQLASAVLVQATDPTHPAKLIMKSGQIINNEVNTPNINSSSTHIGTVYVYRNGIMEMSGGRIEKNNSIAIGQTAAGAIINYMGNVAISGGIIRENKGNYGSAIFYNGAISSSQLIFSGGLISGNTPYASGKQPINEYSPIYVKEKGFELSGGGAVIEDGIYLFKPSSAIKVSDHIYPINRSYRIYLNLGLNYFVKGSVVVAPDGNKVTNVNSYLPYFDVRSNPYVLDQGRTSNIDNVTGAKEEQCLILMKAVYLDSEKGNDSNTGLTPSKAVRSFAEAKRVGELTGNGSSKHYVIYVCGKASNVKDEGEWTLPETAYMCRYTGFPVYESDGTATPENRAYYGYLIEPKKDLKFTNISIQGRRNIDSTASNGDSLVYIPGGVNVTVENGAVFSNNYNNSNYIDENGIADGLSTKGGAFQVAEGGTLTINGGEIKGNSAAFGSAIYLHASQSDVSQSDPTTFGQLFLTSSPVISGNVYLDGKDDKTGAYIQPDSSYLPSSALQITVGNDYSGRPLIKYKDVSEPGEPELKNYSFDDSINALYDIVNKKPNILELSLRKVFYLDGQDGSDDPSHNGKTPDYAFKTLKRTFEAIGENEDTDGVLIYVVGTVDITGEADIHLTNYKVIENATTSHYEGSYQDLDSNSEVKIIGQVYIKRYSQPDDIENQDGYNKATLLDSLFCVCDGGVLTLSGIYLDGHSVRTDSINPTLAASAVVAKSPLITVKGSGVLNCDFASGGAGVSPTVTRFANNINGNNKKKDSDPPKVGSLEGSPTIEGSSAGIELLKEENDEGTCTLKLTEFVNLALYDSELDDNFIVGGTDVYSNGSLTVSNRVDFGGSVFLEGSGSKDEGHDTSRFLTIGVAGEPLVHKFQLLMRDPYQGRTVVSYPSHPTLVIPNLVDDAATYLLEERVKDFFCLTNRELEMNVLELNVPIAVYIDGTDNGNDSLGDPFAGSNPRQPVQTLKRAFELLETRGGNTIYVVNTIQVNSTIQVTGQSYRGIGEFVPLKSTNKVNIVRYIQPDFAINDPVAGENAKYDVPDFTGVLLNVNDGATAQFSENIIFDGHSEPKNDIKLPKEAFVADGGHEAKAPLITVEKGGTLNLMSNVTLRDNLNAYEDGDSEGQPGGAISNSGTTTVDGTLFMNNKAAKGSVAYQDGTFTIVSAPEKLDDHQNTFYLTSENTGTDENPVWGVDHVIQAAVAIPEKQVFDIDMDPAHAVKGRPVVRFTSNSAYDPDADAEHDHFRLGDTVPEYLFLVGSENNPDVLELQDWEVLNVKVPVDIYLVVSRKGSYDSTNKLVSVNSDPSAGGNLFTTPEYVIANTGKYGAKVSIIGFEDQGITADPMSLTASIGATTGAHDLYLAVKGLPDNTDGTGFAFSEIPLAGLTPTTPRELGTLGSEKSGKFTFIGAVGNGFVDKYKDPDYPLTGNGYDAQKYMDGDAGLNEIKAKAKYLLKYKVEIDPSRRNWIP